VSEPFWRHQCYVRMLLHLDHTCTPLHTSAAHVELRSKDTIDQARRAVRESDTNSAVFRGVTFQSNILPPSSGQK
jgi:hypothetical protein